MAEILRKTLSNQSIIGPLHVWCYYQNEEKMTMTTFNFIDALLTKYFLQYFPSRLTWNISEISIDNHVDFD